MTRGTAASGRVCPAPTGSNFAPIDRVSEEVTDIKVLHIVYQVDSQNPCTIRLVRPKETEITEIVVAEKERVTTATYV
jgi:hypothetical protein